MKKEHVARVETCAGCGKRIDLKRVEGWTAEELPGAVFCKRVCLRDWRKRRTG